MPRLHYFQHVPHENLAAIEPWALANGWQISGTQFSDENPELPGVTDVDWLVVLGGPMGVYETDQYDWLNLEIQFIRDFIEAGKPILGICLGAQLMARALDADVKQHTQKEIGWFPINPTTAATDDPIFGNVPDGLTVLHWHGDIFDIPEGAVHLATSAACPNQAFRYGERALALQFHIEATKDWLGEISEIERTELIGKGYVQTPDQLIAGLTHTDSIHATLHDILQRLTQ